LTTITQLVDRIQLILNDTAAAVWAQTDVEEWVIDGIREYSIHFPRTRTTTFELEAAVQSFDLPEDFIAALQVEYPTGETPPQYLQRLARAHPQFWLSDNYYDVEPANANPASASVFYMSASPVAGQELELTYSAYHIPVSNTVPPSIAPITVATYHEHIIEQYAVWQAHVERLATEVQSPDTTIRLIQQYKLAVQATEASYRTSLRQAMAAQSAGGWTGPWRVDANDRIY